MGKSAIGSFRIILMIILDDFEYFPSGVFFNFLFLVHVGVDVGDSEFVLMFVHDVL